MRWLVAGALAFGLTVPAQAVQLAAPVVEERSIGDLQAMMASGRATSTQITKAYLGRIAAMDRKGPTLRAVIAVNPNALDNIETRDQPTTAGSLALAANDTKRDAPVVARLRAAGAVILGKTNLSEWANIRSTRSMSGWSAVGGLVRNPYALDRTACGSSSGTGAAVAASFSAVGLGTETDGSVICPSAMNGLVGLKPTIGAVSRTHVVPISHSQDTPGPMGRSVRDVAILYGAMVGSDPADAVTKDADAHRMDFAAGLSADGLKGVRVGVMRPVMSAALAERFDAALKQLEAAGAVLVEVKQPPLPGIGEAEFLVLQVELKADLNSYLATTPASVKTRTLAQVIDFNIAHAGEEMPFFAQETFVMAEATKGLDDAAYKEARAKSFKLAGEEGITAMLKAGNVRLLVSPSYGLPWLSDPVNGDQFSGPSASRLPAVSGFPHLTVPMGLARGLPVGLSFIGPAWSEPMLLSAGYAFEQQAKARVAPRYLPSVDVNLGSRKL
jgi:amidase